MTDRAPLPYTFREVRAMLQGRIGELLRELGFDERPSGGLITPLNPMRDDRRAGSFVIWVDKDRVGAWKDFATGEQGSVIDLVMGIKGLREPIDAYWWSLNWLGLANAPVASATELEARRRREAADRLAREAKARTIAEEKAASLFKLWLGLAEIGGTLAESYLREARGLPLERLHHIPRALRFSPAMDHIDQTTGEVTTWPCMVAAMTRGTKVTGLHRTWLAPDGSGKAPVDRPKKMVGHVSGAAIRLTAGAANCSPAEAERRGKRGPLAIGEGIETTLTVAIAMPNYRCWAAGSLDLIGLVDWPPCASAVVLLKDNDEHESARKAFDRSADKWRARAKGRPVAVMASSFGSDFNDMVRA